MNFAIHGKISEGRIDDARLPESLTDVEASIRCDNHGVLIRLNAETAPTDRLVEAAMNTEVRGLLDHLKPMEADILRQRFGLDTDKELTLKEIGEKYNLSRERIRQLQEQALTKMRRALQRKDLM